MHGWLSMACYGDLDCLGPDKDIYAEYRAYCARKDYPAKSLQCPMRHMTLQTVSK